ncbi:hypothetical protein LZ554_002760 [Drepanopeziza brunnea f. sp. 'monogermtubi']|nr:hypothetical protein LZ554_002760 [Drepanopeziza brunnea f. sp. 'monogermtubi']
MDPKSKNGSHTNHDRDQRPNGVNGGSYTSDNMQDKSKARAELQQNMTPPSPAAPSLSNGKLADHARRENGENGGNGGPRDVQAQMDLLPQEIIHMTEGYQPLSKFLQRVVQKTHSDLINTLSDLEQMPTPASALNGNSATDDSSQENVQKKMRLMNYATSAHESLTKALVITGWSRKAEDVSKLIDIRMHLEAQKSLYTTAIEAMADNKRALHNFRLPNPDFKTALEALTTGKSSWMPDLGYIKPPPLTAKELLRQMEKLNTLLSMRLNLDDYDKIPPQFKNFTIQSGRATFKVPGEFELDLTVANEDPGSQYWFIDFRFLFRPSSSNMNLGIRNYIESRVNETLFTDGLSGCYKYLHELVLTYKIKEFRRQGDNLARSIWTDTLSVENLNRPISIQYWVGRYSGQPMNGKSLSARPSKSWIILGVHSGKVPGRRPSPENTSRLFIRWFRDFKEVKDPDIKLDDVDISTESLLKTVVGKHIDHILTSMFEKLLAKPLYASRELEISLHISVDDPADSEIKVQLTQEHRLSIKIEPISGRFVLGPVSKQYSQTEFDLNRRSQDPATDGHVYIERLRSMLLTEDLQVRAISVGWTRVNKPGLSQESMAEIVGKEALPTVWFRRPGWEKDWYLVVTQSMGGEKWHLIKTAMVPHTLKKEVLGVGECIKLPIKSVSPTTSYSFLSTLNIFTAGVVSHHINTKTLHARRVQHKSVKGKLAKSIALPSIYAKLSDLIPSKNRLSRSGMSWAKDVIKISFQGIEVIGQKPSEATESANSTSVTQASQSSAPGPQAPSVLIPPKSFNVDERSVLVTEARLIASLPKALLNIKDQVDKDIIFNPETASFAVRLRSKVGDSVIPDLVECLVRVERLVEFIQVLDTHKDTLTCDMVSLGKIVFTYQEVSSVSPLDALDAEIDTPTKYSAAVDFSAADNTMALVLEGGNPHLRIADSLASILNGSEGLNGVATLLPLTLPVLRGLDTMEDAWSAEELSGKGQVIVHARATDSYLIRYSLFPKTSLAASVSFNVKLRSRDSQPWWHVRRVATARNGEPDALEEDLAPLWALSPRPDWKGMRISGVARNKSIENLLVKLDETVRRFALSGKNLNSAVAAPPPGQVQGQAPAPQKQTPTQNPRQQQQQQQQHQRWQPASNQGQNQARNPHNPHNREVVEID